MNELVESFGEGSCAAASAVDALGVEVSTGAIVSHPLEMVFVYSRVSGMKVGAPYQVVVYE